MQLAHFYAGQPFGLRSSIYEAIKRGLSSLRTPEPLTANEWAEKHFYLSAESSQGEKRWVSYPYQRGLLCMMGDLHIEELDVRKSARVGYTKLLLAKIGYSAHHQRRNQCLWQPTDDDSDEFCKTEIEPMIRDVRAVRDIFPAFMAKSKNNTMNLKKFRYSLLYMKGAKSAGNFRRMTLQDGMFDEFDGFDQKVERSADPFTLMKKRLEGATYPKAICGGTPRVKGLSHVEKRELIADVRMKFHITCPHCGQDHPLSFGGKKIRHGLKWDKEDPEGTARHVCPHCLGSINQGEYLRAAEDGCWISECGNYICHGQPYYWTDANGDELLSPPKHVAVSVWTAYSPQVTWGAIVREFLQCVAAQEGGDKGPLEGFVNETLGETWEDESDRTEVGELIRRAEDYPLRTVPDGGLQLVAGIDTQDDRWEVTVYAFGRDEESWVVDYQQIYGNPGDDDEWTEKLLPYLLAPMTHANGADAFIEASSLDTGGHFTHQAYTFARSNSGHKVFAIQGDSKPGMPVKARMSMQDVNVRGRMVKNGVKLWKVGTDTAKDLIFGRLALDPPMANGRKRGYIHLSKHLPQSFFIGLVSEVRRTIKTARGTTKRWEKKTAGIRNEPLDTTVYALHASHMLDHHKKSDAEWSRLEMAIESAGRQPEAPIKPGHVEVREPAKKKPAATIIAPPKSTNNSFASSQWLNRMR